MRMDGGMGEEVYYSVLYGRKVWGLMVKLWKEIMLFREVKYVRGERELSGTRCDAPIVIIWAI